MSFFMFFFFNDTATTEIYTLSLHDALPIYRRSAARHLHRHLLPHRLQRLQAGRHRAAIGLHGDGERGHRSEEHTSELQSRLHLVCRLLLEKKNTRPLSAISIYVFMYTYISI